jgi:hypothetical protein
MKFKYFFLTNRENVALFEYDRSVLNNKQFNSEVEKIILKLRDGQDDLDTNFMSWMTEDPLDLEMTREISSGAQEYTLKEKSFKYVHSLLGNLFSYYHFFPKHKKYSFIKHGYPVMVDFELKKKTRYIVYKKNEEIEDTIQVSDLDDIKLFLSKVVPSAFITSDDLVINQDSILFLQS